MAKYLFTFGVGTPHKGKCVIVESDNEEMARMYVYQKYGQENTCGVYDYEHFSHLIEQYGYKVVEKKKL